MFQLYHCFMSSEETLFVGKCVWFVRVGSSSLRLSLTSMSPGVMEQLDVDIMPYIVLLVVPVLGRMSDPGNSIRFMATQCFATLIRLLPLEVTTPKHMMSLFRWWETGEKFILFVCFYLNLCFLV